MVVVPTPQFNAPATLALRHEGLEVEEYRCLSPLDYGRRFSALWEAAQPFVVVEWDVIPFPGAVAALLACREPWCTHRYPLTPGNLAVSFGIGKYRPVGPAPAEWSDTPWRLLDGAVVPVLQKRLSVRPHVHEPPVAHARSVR